MPAKVYTDKDANLAVLKNKTLAVLGFGSQGHAHALNLKESGCNVIIGLYEGSKSAPVAQSHGFEVVSTAEAVRRADRAIWGTIGLIGLAVIAATFVTPLRIEWRSFPPWRRSRSWASNGTSLLFSNLNWGHRSEN